MSFIYSLFSEDTIFSLCTTIVFPVWAVLMIAPKWEMRFPLVKLVVLIECFFYTMTLAASFGVIGEGSGIAGKLAGFSTLQNLTKTFSKPPTILPSWLHYNACDPIVGNYLVDHNLAASVPLPQPLMALLLMFVMATGPTGFMLYTITVAVYPMVVDLKETKKA